MFLIYICHVKSNIILILKKGDKKMKAKLNVNEMEQALININFFVGGLTDEAIKYYYNKLIN